GVLLLAKQTHGCCQVGWADKDGIHSIDSRNVGSVLYCLSGFHLHGEAHSFACLVEVILHTIETRRTGECRANTADATWWIVHRRNSLLCLLSVVHHRNHEVLRA